MSKIRVRMDVFNRNFACSLNQGLYLYKSARCEIFKQIPKWVNFIKMVDILVLDAEYGNL